MKEPQGPPGLLVVALLAAHGLLVAPMPAAPGQESRPVESPAPARCVIGAERVRPGLQRRAPRDSRVARGPAAVPCLRNPASVERAALLWARLAVVGRTERGVHLMPDVAHPLRVGISRRHPEEQDDCKYRGRECNDDDSSAHVTSQPLRHLCFSGRRRKKGSITWPQCHSISGLFRRNAGYSQQRDRLYLATIVWPPAAFAHPVHIQEEVAHLSEWLELADVTQLEVRHRAAALAGEVAVALLLARVDRAPVAPEGMQILPPEEPVHRRKWYQGLVRELFSGEEGMHPRQRSAESLLLAGLTRACHY